MAFERVPLVADRLLKVPVSVETARRLTETLGGTQVRREDAEAARVRATLPMPASGPAVPQLSVDGATVPLVGGTWAAVKTLALGEVEQTTTAAGAVGIRTTALSSFSRLTDAETFREQVRGELYRRGTAAGVVCAVQDGAEWLQGFVDHHRPDAVRILDFPHAVEHLGTAGRAVFGAGTAAFSEGLGIQAHTFKHGDPDQVLAALRALDVATAVDPEAPGSKPKRSPTSRSADPNSPTPTSASGAIRSAAGRSRAPTSSSSRPDSRAAACTGCRPRSPRWSACVGSCVATGGPAIGRLSGGLTWPTRAPDPPQLPPRTRRSRPRPRPPRQGRLRLLRPRQTRRLLHSSSTADPPPPIPGANPSSAPVSANLSPQ